MFHSQTMMVAVYLRFAHRGERNLAVEAWVRKNSPKSPLHYIDFGSQRTALRQLLAVFKQDPNIHTLVVPSLATLCDNLIEAIQWMERLQNQSTVLVTADNERVWDPAHPVDFVIWNEELMNLDRALRRQRVCKGLAQAKERGIRLGPPLKWDETLEAKALTMRREGSSYRAIARCVGLSYGAVRSFLDGKKL